MHVVINKCKVMTDTKSIQALYGLKFDTEKL